MFCGEGLSKHKFEMKFVIILEGVVPFLLKFSCCLEKGWKRFVNLKFLLLHYYPFIILFF